MGEYIVAILYGVVPFVAILIGLMVIRRDYHITETDATAGTEGDRTERKD